MPGRIVVGVDGSPHARRALDWAIQEARERGTTVEAVLAYDPAVYYPGIEFAGVVPIPPERLEAEAMERLLDSLADVPADAPVDPVVVDGPPARALLEAAEGADLLVVGSRGRGGFAGLLLGSTSRQVVAHAPCPVVVIPAAAGRDADTRSAA